MKLRYKIFLIVIITNLTLTGALYFMIRRIVLSNFSKLETRETKNNLGQAHNALQAMVDNLHSKSSDWAIWDDDYQFVQDHNQTFIDSNLQNQSLQNLKIDLIAFFDLQGHVIQTKAIDSATGSDVVFPQDVTRRITENRLYFHEHEIDREYSGILVVSGQPLLISLHPIVRSDATGPARGTLMFGRYLSPKIVERLSQTTHLNLDIRWVDDPGLPNAFQEAKEHLQKEDTFIRSVGLEAIQSYLLIPDILKKSALILSVDASRATYAQGLHTTRYLLFSLLANGIACAVVLLFSFENKIVKRLGNLSQDVGEIGRKQDFSGRVTAVGKDEIGNLAESINHMLKTLESKVTETGILNENLKNTQNQLIQAQKMEAIGELAAGIAHDFNNLLGVISGYASLLGEEFKDNPKASKKLTTIQKSATRGANLTRELLGFARKGKYEKKTLDLNQVVKEAQSIFKESLHKNVSSKTTLEETLWPIEGDSSQIMQILMNLVINACDAMPEGGEISITSQNTTFEPQKTPHPDLKPGPYVHLSVTDTGTGIPKTLLSKIFDPFFTTKAQGKGTGLGLSMTYGIMKNHEGAVTVESETGRGTTFHLYFPKSNSEAATTHPDPSSEKVKKKITIPAVLIAEDEECLRDLYRDYFSKYFPETKVLIACDGEEALEIFREHHAELTLVLLDVMMPKIQGIQAYKEMGKLKRDLKAIFISGYAESGPIAQLRQTGRVGFIQKPFETQKLLVEIEAILG